MNKMSSGEGLNILSRHAIGLLVGVLWLYAPQTYASLIGTPARCLDSGLDFECRELLPFVDGGSLEFIQADIFIDLTADQLSVQHSVQHNHTFDGFTATLINLFWFNDPLVGGIIGLELVRSFGVPETLLAGITFTSSTISFSIDGSWEPFGTATWDIIPRHAVVPEPSTLAIFAFGLAGLGFVTRRRRTGVGKTEHAS